MIIIVLICFIMFAWYLIKAIGQLFKGKFRRAIGSGLYSIAWSMALMVCMVAVSASMHHSLVH